VRVPRHLLGAGVVAGKSCFGCWLWRRARSSCPNWRLLTALQAIKWCPRGALPLPASSHELLLPEDFSLASLADGTLSLGAGLPWCIGSLLGFSPSAADCCSAALPCPPSLPVCSAGEGPGPLGLRLTVTQELLSGINAALSRPQLQTGVCAADDAGGAGDQALVPFP
jgi:hypothetical protein